MPRVPTLTGKKLLKVLNKDGFILKHIEGSHHVMYHPDKHIVVSVPVHQGKDLGRGLTHSILKQAKLL